MRARYRHLEMQRSEPTNPRRRRPPPPPRLRPPEDPRAHATRLSEELCQTVKRVEKQEPGFDPRLLLKLHVEGIDPQELQALPGLELVSQERETVVVLFATQQGLDEFVARLNQVKRGQRATRQDILFAIKGVDNWTSEDRMGRALRQEGWPQDPTFLVDVELWPLERGVERERMNTHFRVWCAQHNAEILDSVNQETVILHRVRVDRATCEGLLNHRDVRLVDLPPRYQLDLRLIHMPLAKIPPISPPGPGAAGVVVLDSGIATGHPLLNPAIGDAQSFVGDCGPEDECGHGTMVGGLALYGDLWECVGRGELIPELRLFSGRVTDGTGAYDVGFVENHIVSAVEYFTERYGCRVFNISLGDQRKPFTQGHVRGLAAVLDTLARRHGVLFIISAGNFGGDEGFPADWRAEYPDYLLTDAARIIDPAPALNALTVGSLARNEVPRLASRFGDPAYQPVARIDQPSPFSRSGPGPGGAIKPEVVEYGGNCYVDLRTGPGLLRGERELGELSTCREFTSNLFAVDSGTSYAAPKIAHLAGLLLNEYPDATPDLIRALIVAHARYPAASRELLRHNHDGLYRLLGYGRPDPEAVIWSSDNRVTLVSQADIEEDQCHFYQVPIPRDFHAPPARRLRRITVALAHTPLVRRTRIEYKASAITFRVVRARSLEEVVRVFRHCPKEEREKVLPEVPGFRPRPSVRDNGTVQAATWDLMQVRSHGWEDRELFVVVTRSVPRWARGYVLGERYALVIVLEDSAEVQYYTQIRELLRVRVRV